MIRPQYHFRKVGDEVHIWDVRKLVEATSHLPVLNWPLADLKEIDEPYWFAATDDEPTCRRVIEHARQTEATDLSHPILLCERGRVIDGMHRIMKALSLGHDTIKARQVDAASPPDFIDVDPADLPYDP